MPSFVPLLREYRGDLLDLTHMGYVCVVDADSNVLCYAGGADETVFYRSASKPLQALPAITRELDLRFGLTPEESVLLSGSHTGEPFHVAAMESIMRKAGLCEEQLIVKPAVPAAVYANEERIRAGLPARKYYHNCSGKHAALLMLQRDLGGEPADYWKIGSPAHEEVERAISVLSECPREDIRIGIDGCGVPVFAVPIQSIAVAYKNLACLDTITDDALRTAAARYVPLIHRYPHMMRGTGYLCSVINEDSNIVAKGGSNGVYGIGLKRERLGISLKLADGTEHLWPFLISCILRQIGYHDEGTHARLRALHSGILVNDNGRQVGRCEPAFSLERVIP